MFQYFHRMDSLIRRGSVELAREIILLQRKIEEYQHNIKVLEETLINQRELNMRHIKYVTPSSAIFRKHFGPT